MNSAARSSRGVSLIEALVALAVMAFGLLGVVGMQATLRFNADVSRQRAEAVRMAQEQMENLRSFGVLTAAVVPADREYTDIVSGSDTPAPPAGFANTDFTRVTTVLPPSLVASAPKMKSVQVSVSWLDRRTAAGGTPESVVLTSNIAEVAPEVMASAGLPADRSGTQRPRGRHRSIPPLAVLIPGTDTSSFTPPPAPDGISWTFLNATGKIISVCSAPSVCTATSGWLVSGYIRFIAPLTAPTQFLAENPNGLATSFPSIGMQAVLTDPIAPTVAPVCYASAAIQGLAYYCFVPVNASTGLWSGTTLLTPGTTFAAAPTASSNSPSQWKSCRYTPQPTPTPAGGNEAHPLNYTNVASSLTNQNFLVFVAGNGSTAYLCPLSPGTNPFLNSTTFAHQPST